MYSTKDKENILKQHFIKNQSYSQISAELNIHRHYIAKICNQFSPYLDEYIKAYYNNCVPEFIERVISMDKKANNKFHKITSEEKELIQTALDEAEKDGQENGIYKGYLEIYEDLKDEYNDKFNFSYNTFYRYVIENTSYKPAHTSHRYYSSKMIQSRNKKKNDDWYY